MYKNILNYFIKLANDPGLAQRLESKAFKKEMLKVLLPEITRNKDYRPSPEELAHVESITRLTKKAILKEIPEDVTASQKVQCLEWLKSIAADHHEFIIVDSAAETHLRLHQDLEQYFLFHNYVETSKKDLPSIKSPEELHNVVEAAFKVSQEKSESSTSKENVEKTTEYLPVKDPDWTVLIPHSHGAAVFWGRPTRWCTAASDPANYNNYHKPDNPLFIFINKHNSDERYQFNYGVKQFMNKENKQMLDTPTGAKLHNLLLTVPGILNRFPKIKSVKSIHVDDKGDIHKSTEEKNYLGEGYTLQHINGAPHHRQYDNGKQEWVNPLSFMGNLHRDDGPAVIHPNGTQEYYQQGQLHRDDGPAIINPDGTVAYYTFNKLHRDDGPAVINSNGTKEWYKHGKLHRQDGPAIERADGSQQWWKHGQQHREDGPAVIHDDGTEIWYQNGKKHREDGPAVIYPDGTKEWYQHGKYIDKPPEQVNKTSSLVIKYLKKVAGDGWAYHATSWRNLSSIRRKGLIPEVNDHAIEETQVIYPTWDGRKETYPAGTYPEFIYFEEDEAAVEDYGDLILRFPMPSDAKDCLYESGAQGMTTSKQVPPELIQYKKDDTWVPLKSKK